MIKCIKFTEIKYQLNQRFIKTTLNICQMDKCINSWLIVYFYRGDSGYAIKGIHCTSILILPHSTPVCDWCTVLCHQCLMPVSLLGKLKPSIVQRVIGFPVMFQSSWHGIMKCFSKFCHNPCIMQIHWNHDHAYFINIYVIKSLTHIIYSHCDVRLFR